VKSIRVYGTRLCPYCQMAKRLLTNKGAKYEEVLVDTDLARRTEMTERSGGRRTVPQIFIGERHVGGYEELAALERAGELDPLLQDNSG
jgi:glutaredoxin 3